MSRLFVIAALAFAGAQSAMAAVSTTAFNCTAASAEKGIDGYNFTIAKTNDGFRGVFSPMCRTCRVIPTVYRLQQTSGGMEIQYEGDGVTTQIHMESFAPTRSHPAQISGLPIPGDQPISFTCVQP